MGIASIYRSLGKEKESREYVEISRGHIPQNDDYWYNQTCLEAILGNMEIAFENLKRAIDEMGFDKEWAWEDPDFVWIRGDPRFAEIVGPKLEK